MGSEKRLAALSQGAAMRDMMQNSAGLSSPSVQDHSSSAEDIRHQRLGRPVRPRAKIAWTSFPAAEGVEGSRAPGAKGPLGLARGSHPNNTEHRRWQPLAVLLRVQTDIHAIVIGLAGGSAGPGAHRMWMAARQGLGTSSLGEQPGQAEALKLEQPCSPFPGPALRRCRAPLS